MKNNNILKMQFFEKLSQKKKALNKKTLAKHTDKIIVALII